MIWSNEPLECLIDTLESGSRPTGGASTDSGEVLSIGGENILQSGGVTLEAVKRVPVAFFKRMTKGHLRTDDVLTNKDGAQTGKVGWYHPSRDLVACINEHVFLLRGEPDRITQGYLYYSLLSDSGQAQIRLQISGSAQPGLKTGFTKGVTVEFPTDIREQSMIVRVLSTVDRAIEKTEALIAKYQRIKTGLMQDLLTRGIDEHGNLRSEHTHKFKDSPLGRVPVEWDVTLLDYLAVRGSGHTPNKQRPTYWNGGIKWVSLADSRKLDDLYISKTDKEISELGLRNSSAVLHPAGTVILSRDAGVGKSAILAHEMAVSQHFMAWRCKPRKLDNIYLYYWLQRDKPRFEGIASGSTIVTIGLQFFRAYSIAAPREVDEQIAISTKLRNADSAIAQTTLHSRKLRRLKTALMQDLLTGNRRVTALLEQGEGATA